MKCYKQLVNSKFLAKASKELQYAQSAAYSEASFFEPQITFNKSTRRRIYDDYVQYYDLLKELQDTHDLVDNKDLVFYIQEDNVLFVYSRSKSIIKEAVLYSYNVYGNVPLHKSRHIVNNHTWFTLLVDTRFEFPGSSPN